MLGFTRLVALSLAFVTSFSVLAQADIVVIGNANGEVFARDEFDLTSAYPNGYINYGGALGITSMAAGVGNDVAIGTQFGQPDVRQSNDLVNSGVPTTNFTGSATAAISAMATRSTGDVVMGTEENGVFVRDRTNLTALAPGYVGGDGLNFNAPIRGIGMFTNNDVAIGNDNGEVFLRQSLDLTQNASGAASAYVNYGIAVSSLAVNSNDKVIIGLSNGLVDVRDKSNLLASETSVNFGVAITALATLANGDVVIGTGSGHVSIRSAADVVNGVITGATFTGGAAITSLTVTSNGNVVIGTADNLVFVRRANDLTLTPVGYVGGDGLNFNASIGGLAATLVPEPASLALLGLGGVLIASRRRTRA